MVTWTIQHCSEMFRVCLLHDWSDWSYNWAIQAPPPTVYEDRDYSRRNVLGDPGIESCWPLDQAAALRLAREAKEDEDRHLDQRQVRAVAGGGRLPAYSDTNWSTSGRFM